MVAWGVEAQGLSPAKIFAAVGIDPGILGQRGTRVAIAPIIRAWEQIVGRLKDPLSGLRLADALPFGTGDILDYLLRSAATAGDALRVLARYAAPLMNDADHMALMVSGDEARMRFGSAGNVPYTCEVIGGIFARRARELFGPTWSLRAASFAHQSQGPRAVYDRVFQAPVHFGMPWSEVVFDRQLLDLPMPEADARLHAILASHADELLSVLEPRPPATFVEAVEQALVQGLAEGDATLTRVSDELGMSARTVQRRLRDVGLSHREVLRKLRLELAARALLGPQPNQREIARALGYSGNGAFHRAFKRWSGMTPGEIRAGGGTPTPALGTAVERPPARAASRRA